LIILFIDMYQSLSDHSIRWLTDINEFTVSEKPTQYCTKLMPLLLFLFILYR